MSHNIHDESSSITLFHDGDDVRFATSPHAPRRTGDEMSRRVPLMGMVDSRDAASAIAWMRTARPGDTWVSARSFSVGTSSGAPVLRLIAYAP